MATGPSETSGPTLSSPRGAVGSSSDDNFLQAPLVPFALAVTAGIVLDRTLGLPLLTSLLGAVAGIMTWAITFFGGKPRLAVVYLGISAAALGGGYHHGYRNVYRADDIGEFVTDDAQLTQLRGVLEEEPNIRLPPPPSPFQSIPRAGSGTADSTVAPIRVSQLRRADDWREVSGRAQLIVTGNLIGLHAGDEIEVVGRLSAPAGPANPGEFDYAAYLLDQRIRAQLVVAKTPDGVTRLARGWQWSFSGWLAVLRGWAQRNLNEERLGEQSGLATALLLGQTSSMTKQDWDKYIHTGVIHVLAISGQHLMVLAAFLWWSVRLLGIRRGRAAWFVALFLLGYSLLTGGRPAVMRSAAMVCVACGGLVLHRRTVLPNSFALAWLVVAVLNPTDLFTTGCQLSFLSVAVLYWNPERWFRRDKDALDRLVEKTRPVWQKMLFRLTSAIGSNYALTAVIWLCLLPLVAFRCQVIPFVGLAIGPPVVLLTSVALITGFLLLLMAAVFPPLIPPFAWITRWCLAGCDGLVCFSEPLPGSSTYLGTVPEWWLWFFYAGLLAVLTMRAIQQRWRWAALAGLVWLCTGFLSGATALPADELRCTFLAVGHGGCTVIETPDGRTLLYDAGALGGPDVTRRQIAPYLWYRGIRRIDEVILSHADLDHFNGMEDLLKRFAIGQVTMTPSFSLKDTPAVRRLLQVLQNYHVPKRVVYAGDRLGAGEVQFEVLHPPAVGPEGNENARSLVLLIRHAGHTLLLTGDLEDPGLARVLTLAPVHADVFMAPHHGSRFPNTPQLAGWARPRVVISCEGPPRAPMRPPEPYTPMGAVFLGTWPNGAITVRSHTTGIVIETFQTRRRLVVRTNRHL